VNHSINRPYFPSPKIMSYIGRFAPSPSGPLHFGSLVAALASYLDAKANRGQWLVRMEDIDPPRIMPGAADSILRTLENYGLHWDQQVLYQSTRQQAYEAALDHLKQHNLIYTCDCSRQQIKSHGNVYAGICRTKNNQTQSPSAQRIKVPNVTIGFDDQIMGKQTQKLHSTVGDFILRRKDNLFAYQLAVVVDDAEQDITHIVRGHDLLDSTARQIFLQQSLGLDTPDYAHFPVITNNSQQKLSKQNLAPEIHSVDAIGNLSRGLAALGIMPSQDIVQESPENLLSWAVDRWDINKIESSPSIPESNLPHY